MDTQDNKLTKPTEAVEHVNNWWQSDWTQTWLIERPIRIAVIIFIALIAHWLLRRLIRKMAQKATTGRTVKSTLTQALDNAIPDSKQLRTPRELGRAIKRPLAKSMGLEVSSSKDVKTTRDFSKEMKLQAQAREERRIARIQTLASVASSAAAIFVWGWAALAILAQLDVNVAPLIASAGVVGVALGFGAQSLVKDFLSGIFMLIEDQYGIGDCIDLGDGVFGDVEDITLRITTVRDIDGALWYVRNGEILKVANHSNDFAIARLQIPLSLSNDANAADAFLRKAIAEALEKEEIRSLVLSSPNYQGISKFETDYASFRVSIKTLPGRQWDVQRAVQGYVWNEMSRNGISTPYPKGIGIKPDER